MSTRCNIAMVLPDQTVRSIYVHFDGYPEGVGYLLYKFYKEPQKVTGLLDLGDLSSLGASPDTAKGSNSHCNSYASRGEKGTEAKTWGSLDDFLSKVHQEYIYVWINSTWYVKHNAGELERLTKVLHVEAATIDKPAVATHNNILMKTLQSIKDQLSTVQENIAGISIQDLISFPENVYNVLEIAYRKQIYAINQLEQLVNDLKTTPIKGD